MTAFPPAVLERIEQAFVDVLRRQHPDAAFIVRDVGDGERPVGEPDANVGGEVRARAALDVHPLDEAREDGPARGDVEAAPKVDEGASNGKPGAVGG